MTLQWSNEDTGIIFRTTERPEYVRRSYPAVMDNSSPGARVLVMINSPDADKLKETQDVIERVSLGLDVARVMDIRVYSHLLGVPGSINTGVKEVLKRWPNVKRIMVCDDDCLAPAPAEEDGGLYYWDEALSLMLEAGWKVVGHPSRNTFYNKSTLRAIQDVWGHKASHVAGAFAGFSVETWKKGGGIPSAHMLYGFGPFCINNQPNVAWCTDKRFTVVDFDRLGHPWSLRDGEYWDWYNHMRPNKAVAIERKK